MPMDRSVSDRTGITLVSSLACLLNMLVGYANSVDPDQTSQNAMSDLGLRCLSVSHFMGR